MSVTVAGGSRGVRVHVELSPDEAFLLRLVGEPTFRRGRSYADTGAVIDARWQAGRQQVYGEVTGTAATPYTTWVRLGRGADGRLTSFRGTCTCPVGHDCKHAVAVTLTALSGGESAAPAAVPARPWETPLRDLLREPRADDEPAVALQFEVVEATARSPRTGLASPRRIAMRPVTPGRNGGWVRNTVSWLSTQYGGGSRTTHRSIRPEHARLLREIAALDAAAQSTYYGGAGQVIHLDALASRRIWDLLAEARTLGIPLVQAGQRAAPVTLLTDPARLVVEVGRDDGGLALRPRLSAGREQPAPDATLLIGDPAHGVAWWDVEDGDDAAQRAGELRLARLAEPADAVLRNLVEHRRLRVPADDEGAFFARYYPALQQRVRLVPADPSVQLPEQQPPVLVLEADHGAADRLALRWCWRYVVGDAERTEPLWPPPRAVRGRDLDAEAAVVAAVEAVAAPVAALWERAPAGERLAPGVTLDGFDTVRFASGVLPRIAELPDVEVRTTGEPRTYQEATSAPVVTVTGAPEDRDWFDLSVTVTVDGQEVPFDRLFVALAAGERHLVLDSGTWFSLDRPELAALAALIAEARALNDPGPRTARLSRYQADLWAELERLGVVRGQAAEWQAAVRALRDVTAIEQPPVPAGLSAVLRPYQEVGFGWLSFLWEHRLGGVLADEMGLGKTVQTLALVCHAKERGERAPFLVVAPTSVVETWAAECRRFAPDLDVRLVTETGRRRDGDIAALADGADVVVTSYALFRLEYDEYAALGWAGLVLDEAQFVKNAKSRAYQCARRLPAPFKLAITGTPMENNLMELWSLLSITAPGLFPHPAGFEQHYRTPIERDDDRDRLAQLRRRVRPLMLRRTKEQVVTELPPKQEQVVELRLNPKHRRVYQTYLQRERQKVLGLLGDLEHNRFEIFRSLTLLRQASLDPALVDPRHRDIPSTKLDALMELLTEITSEGHRTLVFSQFTRFLAAARQRLDDAGIAYCYLDGTTRRRPEVIERFRSGDAPVFLISLKAGGFGLTLTEADYCILLDPWWNPATEAQAVDRVHRIGQTRTVMVYRLVAKDTIEEKVMALKARKAALFASVMADGGAAPRTLTAADIRGILE